MLDFQSVGKSAAILRKHIQLSLVDAEKAVATFDEYDLAQLVEIDETTAATSIDRQAAAKVDAKKKMQAMIDTARQRSSAA